MKISRRFTEALLRARVRRILSTRHSRALPRPRFANRSAFYRDCRRRLIRALAPAWHGSRAALKAAVHRWLAPRRRDLRFLAGLRHAALAPLGVALLIAMLAEPATADPTRTVAFAARTGVENPLAGIDPGGIAAPSFADLDGDGDLDLLVFSDYSPSAGGLEGVGGERQFYTSVALYFENTGSKVAPVFEARNFPGPVVQDQFGAYPVAAAADLDADGDVDFVLGNRNGDPRWLENTGDAVSPTLEMRTGPANLFDGIAISGGCAPALGDLDKDGDLDLVLLPRDGGASPHYFENTGSVVAPAFAEHMGPANPFADIALEAQAAAVLADFDRDGDLDLILTGTANALRFFENIGTTLAPRFFECLGPHNPLDGMQGGDNTGFGTPPALADLDADGDLDLTVGTGSGSLAWFENTGEQRPIDYVLRENTQNPLDILDADDYSTQPILVDLDADGDLDLISTDESEHILYLENTGTGIAPVFVERTGEESPFSLIAQRFRYGFALGDIDTDGDLDLISEFTMHENIGNAANPSFDPEPTAIPFTAPSYSYFYEKPILMDYDGDGDLDVAIAQYVYYGHSGAESYGSLAFFENTGSAIAPEFNAKSSRAKSGVPITNADPSGFNAFDADGDGDFDIAAGGNNVRFYENTGDAVAPAFERRHLRSNPFFRKLFYDSTLGDLDGDGDLDLVGMANYGLSYFEAVTHTLNDPEGEGEGEGLGKFEAEYFNPGEPEGYAWEGETEPGPCGLELEVPLGFEAPRWNRPRVTGAERDLDCNLPADRRDASLVPYAAFPIIATEASRLLAEVRAASGVPDTVLTLYCDPFNASKPLKNLVAYDDDSGLNYTSAFTSGDQLDLQANTRYWLVVTLYDQPSAGPLELCINGGFVLDPPPEGEVTEGEGEGEGRAGNGEAEPLVEGASDGEGTPEGEGAAAADPPFCTIALNGAGLDPPASTSALGLASFSFDPAGGAALRIEHNLARPFRVQFEPAPGETGETVVVNCFDFRSPITTHLPIAQYEKIRENYVLHILSEDGPDTDIGGEANCLPFLDAVPEAVHSADRNRDSRIDLSELLRLIQFFNSDGYACADPLESTEDGFHPGPGAATCPPHNSDYAPQDFAINLSELLRLVQFFNSTGFFYCPDADPPTEDGYCPGM